MSAAEKRNEFRIQSNIRSTPVSCVLVSENDRIDLEVVNFHFRGACLRLSRNDYRFQTKNPYLYFKIGTKELTEKIIFRIVWETVSENGLFGVEFTTESSFVLSRAQRFASHQVNTPVVSAKDPLDPNRILYLKVMNASSTGMLLSTSMSNKHIFPGMELREATLTIPSMGKTVVDLFIENSRPGSDSTILYGVSIKGNSKSYNTLIAKYLSTLGSAADKENRIDLLAESNLLQRDLREHLTIREIKDLKSYQEVLKLRYLGYGLAGKVDKSKSWEDMGEGLDEEGIVLGAYLGGQLVSSIELRLHNRKPIRLSKKFNLAQIPGIRSENLAELNKLVVHPKAQSSDIVLGIFQKIHALCVMNGKPDGLIAAEPKLISLYERLGFRKTAITYPHPVKAGVELTLMIIQGETYATSEGMNPYAWSMAFSETQQFFQSIGLESDYKLPFRRQIVKLATKLTIRFRKKKRKSTAKDKADADLNVEQYRNTSDPRWTKQHLNATVLLPYILESEQLIGAEETRKILLDFGFSPTYFRSVSNWVSIEFFDEFIARFSMHGDPYILNRKAGYKSVTKEILGANYFIVKHFTPRMAFNTMEKYIPKFNKTRIYKVIDSSPTHARIRLTNPDKSLLPKHPSAKENWYALAEAYVLALTGKNGSIKPVKSAFDGDEYCEFVVTWTNPVFRPITFALTSLGVAGLAIVLNNAYSSLGAKFFFSLVEATIGIGTLLYLAYLARSYYTKYREMLESMDEFEKEADERYRELQNSKAILEKSYQEGKILETLNKEIQVTENLDQILGVALDFLAEKFEFKRSFAMIKDAEEKYLRTTAVHGAQGPIQELWNFKVDVSLKRDNPLVLSSVYHSSQSILISNVSEHKYQLNEASRRLLELLKTEGFAIVPIPSGKKNWGVLIADKSESKDIITRRDLVALQRVAQSVGLALDKKAKIESEVHIRKVFEKYVPSSVVSGIMGTSANPRLGGQKINAICLFLDIRNFTNLSAQLPPEILCELLNQIFDIVQKNVAMTNGMIDKFLGDGALVTWGTVPGSRLSPKAALDTAKAILQDLAVLNSKFVSEKGLKPVEVGIGIHQGSVIAGNIGSHDRMEFTVIGNTVNIASRLEQLTKVYKCQIIVSESFLAEGLNIEGWQKFENVQVRGLEEKISVYGMVFESNNEARRTA